MARIVFVCGEGGGEARRVSVHAEAGQSILEAARLGGVGVETPCGGEGACGKCLVTAASTQEAVPACSTPVKDGEVYAVPDYAGGNKSLRILSARAMCEYSAETAPFITKEYSGGRTNVYGGGRLLGGEEGDSSASLYGLAVDIGTTTIVAELIDLRQGKTLACESALNPQTKYAQDVLGRIRFAGKEGGLAALYGSFAGVLNALSRTLAERSGIDTKHIYETVYSGNTTMLHLACNIDPSSLGRHPYTPQTTGGVHLMDAGVRLSPFALIYLPPVISAWVGADIASGILATGLSDKKGLTLFVDIGTNGEIVLAKDGRLAASSTAAGPAFEGMNIACGMRAQDGAIEAFAVREDGSLSFTLIGREGALSEDDAGSAGAAGICGSGILDIAAELVRTGLVDKRGRFVQPGGGEAAGKLAARVRRTDAGTAFFITEGVYISQNDIRQIQLAKSAIRSGIELLLARFGVDARDVDRAVIAGSFGYHLNEKSLVTIGLLPPAFAGKVSFAGNTSLAGAAALLLSAPLRERLAEIAARVEKIELAEDAGFEKSFVKYIGF
ncbi:MAG: ASKHA domain-containing protein [Spirochaetaceae bacterium]|jgi:uncharacterized 2Fe-2S/4Fe-4S cluster protein (DUF4445 family)|nr:ASKHA domain-containing protein [Spirochaetaceae bacterium]